MTKYSPFGESFMFLIAFSCPSKYMHGASLKAGEFL